jgi:DNA polymerase-3 subunit alpha
VFQLDGGPMRSLLRSMVPDSFEDISAVLALYRPGPMGANAHNDYADRKNKRKPVVPIHPELAEPLDEILGDTYGLIVYQEQVMAIAQKLAGYSLGAADLLRRAMGKKKKEILDKEYVPFSGRHEAHGYSDARSRRCGTSWSRSPTTPSTRPHGRATGWSRSGPRTSRPTTRPSTWPPCSPASATTRTSRRCTWPSAAGWASRCCRPDVNSSVARFSSVGDDIRFGMAAVRNVGHNVVESIVRVRKEKGAYTDFYDFLRKVDAVVCNKKTIESLIKAGAFDSMGHTRRGLLAVHADAIDSFLDVKRNEAVGQFDLFADLFGDDPETNAGLAVTPPIPTGEWSKSDRLNFEREMLGPLRLRPSAVRRRARAGQGGRRLDRRAHGGRRGRGRQGDQPGRHPLRRAATDHQAGSGVGLGQPGGPGRRGRGAVLPQHVRVGGPVHRRGRDRRGPGRVDRRDDQPRIMAMDLSIPDITAPDVAKPVVLSLPPSRCTPPLVERLKEVLASHPGSAEVHLKLVNGPTAASLYASDPVRVAPTSALMADLKACSAERLRLSPAPAPRAPITQRSWS